jgi:plasmid stability protein
MRTTLNLDDSLLREARKRAAREGRTLTSIFEEALRLLLTQPRPRRPYRFAWVTRRGTGAPAVDVADRDALYDRMEGVG